MRLQIPVPPPPSTAAAKPLSQDRGGASAGATADSKARTLDTAGDDQGIAAKLIQNREKPAPAQAQAAPAAEMIGGQQALHGAAVARPQSSPTIAAGRAQPNMFSADRAAAAAPSSSPAPAKVPAPTMAEAPPAPAAPVAMDGLSVDAASNASATVLKGDGVATAAATPGFTLRAMRSVILPSRLPALSTAANGHQVLAIDTQNTLFYSDDGGQHWTAVATQWRGRAVRVSLARTGGLPAAATYSVATSSFGVNGSPVTAAAGTTLSWHCNRPVRCGDLRRFCNYQRRRDKDCSHGAE